MAVTWAAARVVVLWVVSESMRTRAELRDQRFGKLPNSSGTNRRESLSTTTG